TLSGADRPAERPPPAERLPDRPNPDQLRAVEANLLQNLPRIFVMTQDFSIYHKDLVFDNRIRGTKSVGIVPYIKQCALLRIVGHIKFSYVTLQVLQSSAHPEDDSIRIRWRIRGVSALKSMLMFWKFNIFKLQNSIDEHGVDWYDGYSIFQVGGDGKIHTHIADKVMPDWSRELDSKPALGGLAALVYGLLPGATAGAELGQLLALAARLEWLERQIDTALPLSASLYKTAGST
ncbi:uncharacterized protein C6orf136 homolog, partial [Pollicipes pollicipes]|uniref:uncharacterized protein C6orf136 homolog n=1 Tax=Pollicipes pollicipes TaxID=41117 RepID=UPI001885162F